jgi:hypothetical protein
MKIHVFFGLIFVSTLSGAISNISANADDRACIGVLECGNEEIPSESELDKILVIDSNINNIQLEQAKRIVYFCINKTMLSSVLSGTDRNNIYCSRNKGTNHISFLKGVRKTLQTHPSLPYYMLDAKRTLYSPPNTRFVRGYHSDGKFIPSDEGFEFKLVDN